MNEKETVGVEHGSWRFQKNMEVAGISASQKPLANSQKRIKTALFVMSNCETGLEKISFV